MRNDDSLLKTLVGDMPDFTEHGNPPCSETDPDAFFPEKGEHDAGVKSNRAMQLCRTSCPYVERCLAWAIDNNEIGVWGGTNEYQRRLIRRGSLRLSDLLPR